MAGPKVYTPFRQDERRVSGAGRRIATPGGVYNMTPSRILFESGGLSRLPEVMRDLGVKKALVVTTPGRQSLGQQIAGLLGSGRAELLPEAISQVPIESALRGREIFRASGADVIITAGGGAAIGLGKGICLELGAPIIAIPTTYSGSEMTGFCGITIDGVKRMHVSLKMLASCVIYDPKLSVTLPIDVSAASAFNALAHCIDVMYVPTVSPLILPSAVEGAQTVMEALPRVARDPSNVDARADLLYGAMLGGAALTGGFAFQHGLAHTLGGSFGVPHGPSHALVLPHVTAYNQRYAPQALDLLVKALGMPNLGGGLFDLLAASGLPQSLRAYGLDESIIDRAADITVETDNGLNPGPITRDCIAAILRAALEGKRPTSAQA
jgi:maleylacetate reductase